MSSSDQTTRPTPAKASPFTTRAHATRTWIRTAASEVRAFAVESPVGFTAALVCGLLALTFIAVAIVGVIKAALWVGSGQVLHDLVRWLPGLRIATDPIGHWLTAHTAGLPLSPTWAGALWAMAGGGIFLAARSHHRGALLLWPLFGAATAAMAWAGTPEITHRPITAGIVGVLWAALSLLLPWSTPSTEVVVVEPERCCPPPYPTTTSTSSPFDRF